MKLADIATYVTDRIKSTEISLSQYVTTDSILQNKQGRECAQNLPPAECNLINFKEGDILVANIRPYLKKIWMADCSGGSSNDVLVFRAKDLHSSKFLYAVLLQDSFFDYAMLGSKGSKMPRGDKDQIMRFKIPTFLPKIEKNIGDLIINIDKKIAINRSINHNL